MLWPAWGQQHKQKAACTPDAPVDAAASRAGAAPSLAPSLRSSWSSLGLGKLPWASCAVFCSGRWLHACSPAVKAPAGRECWLGRQAQPSHHSECCWQSHSAAGAGAAHMGMGMATEPPLPHQGWVWAAWCIQEWSMATRQVGGLGSGSKHTACLMNAFFISCVSCWKYQSGSIRAVVQGCSMGLHSSQAVPTPRWDLVAWSRQLCETAGGVGPC